MNAQDLADDELELDDEEGLELGQALTRMLGLLVDAPEEVHVSEEIGADETIFRVTVAPDDLGKLIGRQGRTARSLRDFLDVRGGIDKRRYSLEIRELP